MNAPTDKTPSVSVVVPTRGRPHLLKKCLESLLCQDYEGAAYEVVVIEDGTEGGREVVASLSGQGPAVSYFRIPHGGPARVYDAGLRHARHDIVAFIDDDAVAPPNWLQELVSVLQKEKSQSVGGVGGRISQEYPVEDLEARILAGGELRWTGFNAVFQGHREVDFVPGSNMAFWRELLVKIGGFDSTFSREISWRHETDVCLRVKAQGYRLLYNPKATVLHQSARWKDPLERVRPSVVWYMACDDAYFRAKNFGGQGVWGAAASNAKQALHRLAIGTITLLLVPVHLFAWVPGAIRGFRSRARQTRPPQAR